MTAQRDDIIKAVAAFEEAVRAAQSAGDAHDEGYHVEPQHLAAVIKEADRARDALIEAVEPTNHSAGMPVLWSHSRGASIAPCACTGRGLR
jgi:hypothetical protein